VVVREDDVQKEEHAKGDVEVHRHQLFHAGSQDLHDHLALAEPRPVHLPERRGGQRLRVESLEQLGDRSPELAGDHLLDGARRQRRHAVGELTDLTQVRLRQDVGPRREYLGELDVRGPEGGDGRGESRRAVAVFLRRQRSRPPDQDPSPAVAQKGDDEGEEPIENVERAHVTARA
jgi:hypothetical protein